MTLRASGLWVTIGETAILRDVDVEVRPGEVLAVIGPNGAGKSTLLHALSGARKPDQGEATLDGTGLHDWRPADLAVRRAVLPQSAVLNFPFRVLDVVMLGRSPHAGRSGRRDDLGIAEAALREADMAHMIERVYPTLSGGERQRVQLARVLAQIWPLGDGDGRGRYLLLDEPTNNLDIAHQQTIMATARRFAGAGLGVVTILHDPNLAALYADRVIVLDKGELVASGAPDAVITEELFASTFGLRVAVMRHPVHDRPVFLPL